MYAFAKSTRVNVADGCRDVDSPLSMYGITEDVAFNIHDTSCRINKIRLYKDGGFIVIFARTFPYAARMYQIREIVPSKRRV